LDVGIISIGRNEGERLVRCVESIRSAVHTVYVDSNSTDDSVQAARKRGVDVVELDGSRPFTAARARNAGFRRLRDMAPEVRYVQFIDGDCELMDGWITHAAEFMSAHEDIGATSGTLRERHPDRSVYNWMCDREWSGPSGEARLFGGIVMMRADAFQALGGFREDLIAGEEPELAIRLRAGGWRIWRLDRDMAVHDAEMLHFQQWWRRAVRAGYAFAHGAYLHGASSERHWVWESRRAWIWGVWLPLGCLAAGLALGPWGWMAWLIYPLQTLRQTYRNRGSLAERAILATFQVLARFPEAIGQLKFSIHRVRKQRS
jgi:GT2 family glycosyltransferase